MSSPPRAGLERTGARSPVRTSLDDTPPKPRYDYRGAERETTPDARGGRRGEEGGFYRSDDSFLRDSRVEELYGSAEKPGSGSGGAGRSWGERGGASGHDSRRPLFPPDELDVDDDDSPTFLTGAGAGPVSASPGKRVVLEGAVDEFSGAAVLLAHVVQLRSLWKYEHAQGKALRELLRTRDGESWKGEARGESRGRAMGGMVCQGGGMGKPQPCLA